ncbi:uncharacterized protein LOC118455509 [Neolamprologus brichardi]|uniref:uncharacterized protein LOC118455509 n=1 Tax=Neolamprologus brichardi TaxID=32507 RepID=UPI001643D577|nr:uncharacterized protein LOC118455509 [Neolamprologus brichardi]
MKLAADEVPPLSFPGHSAPPPPPPPSFMKLAADEVPHLSFRRQSAQPPPPLPSFMECASDVVSGLVQQPQLSSSFLFNHCPLSQSMDSFSFARHPSFSPDSCSFGFEVREQLPETSAPSVLEHQAKPHFRKSLSRRAQKRPEFKSKDLPEKSYLLTESCSLSLLDIAPAAVPSQMVVEAVEGSLLVAQTATDRAPSFWSATFTSSGSTYGGALGSTVVPVTSALSDSEHQPKPDLCLPSVRLSLKKNGSRTSRFFGSSLPPTRPNEDVPVGLAMAPEMAARLNYIRSAASYTYKPRIKRASQPHHELEAQSDAPQPYEIAGARQRMGVIALVADHQNLPTVLRHQSAVLNAAESPEALKLKWMKIFQMQHSVSFLWFYSLGFT